jgi:hypothetical protein
LNVTFALKEFFKDAKSNAHHVKHFLLDQARLIATLTFADSSKKVISPPTNTAGNFVLVLDSAAIPDNATTGHKKLITRLSIEFIVDYTIAPKTFRLLRIMQDFSLKALPTNSDQNIDYEVSAFFWTHSKTSKLRKANAGVHPLLDLRRISRNLVLINALVLDLTTLWDHLHDKNKHYKRYKDLTLPTKVTFKVFAHLGGNAFIWYGIIPAYLATVENVFPHVFYSPSDYAENQNERDEKKYLLDNGEHLDKRSGKTLLMGYLLPPNDDDKISALNPKNFTKIELTKWVTRARRNVVNFGRTTSTPPQMKLRHWSIGAGFERAFYGLRRNRPQQFLLMPQVVETGNGVRKGSESEPHLKSITDAIVDVLQTNTDLLPNDGRDELVAKGKMVLSCYSESGFDLWKSSGNNIDHIKAIIGIEPNSTNPSGKDIIPKLLARKIRVFIIGRHQGFNDHYRPKISAALQSQIRFLPDEPKKILKYPPDPDSNNFVKFRVARVTDVTLDPLMLENEKDILKDLASPPQPKTGKAAIPFIFRDINNSDKLSDGDLASIFYTHNFALTGGQDMTFADPNKFYGKAVTYRTFFQQAVDEIG